MTDSDNKAPQVCEHNLESYMLFHEDFKYHRCTKCGFFQKPEPNSPWDKIQFVSCLNTQAELREALQGLMDMIERGILVRDTSHDHEPAWVSEQIPLVKILHSAQKALDKANGL